MYKTAEEIRNEYVKKVQEYTEKQDAARLVDKDGNPKDRTKDIYVTDICVWNNYCPKQVYFGKVCKRPSTPEACIRFTVGNVVHEIPLWNNEDPVKDGYEQAFTWNGLRCRMDEIDVDNGIILDKKTVATLPTGAKAYVTEQLNIYRVIAEDNAERPIKINQLFVLNLCVTNGAIQVLPVPMWDKYETIERTNKTMTEIRDRVANKDPPDVNFGSKGWICSGCQYGDLCKEAISTSLARESLDSSTGTSIRKTIDVTVGKKRKA